MPATPDEEYSDNDSDDGFNDDMEALKRACQLTGTPNPTNHRHLQQRPSGSGSAPSESDEEEGDDDDDLQLVRSIRERFALSTHVEEEPITMKPLCTLPPHWSDSDDCEDDYETLRAIQRRFAAYNDGGLKDNSEEFLHRPGQVGATTIDTEKEPSNSFVERTNTREGFLNCVDTTTSEPTGQKSEVCDDSGEKQPPDLVECGESGADDVAGLPPNSTHFPKSALAFVDAIRKNRSCQKLVRSKMLQMEARIEELKKLTERVKMLKAYQVACKKRTGRALSQKKDARVQLISVPKPRANTKFNETKIPAIQKGPPENVHVAKYKEALATFPISVSRQTWSKEEKENLVKGVKQQFQGMLLQRSVDLLSDADGPFDSSNVDCIMESIKDVDITSENIRLFLPKVNWEQLAAMYVPGRSGAECQARFLNCEDPLINHKPWTASEDKNLLHIIQQKKLYDQNWIDIAASLRTNRTPFQCLARFQRSLNPSILKREWKKEEDDQLRAAVETYGVSNWQAVASEMVGRTGTQCSNRWLKTLHPARQRVGRWTAEEDKRLKVAVTLFGPKTWKKVASYVPGRTQVQCRERWVNCLDPSLNLAEWTEEEDSKLESAIAEHGHCWSKVAACIPSRTDNQCLRRWKLLFPNEVPLLQAAKKIQKAALISNFVDRETERPALGPNDFVVPEAFRIAGSENIYTSRRKKGRSRRRGAQEHIEEDSVSSEICPDEDPWLSSASEIENMQGRSITTRRRGNKSLRSVKKKSSPLHSSSSLYPDSVLLDVNGGENRKSCVDSKHSKRRPHLQKKRSGVKSESVEVPGTVSQVDTQIGEATIGKIKMETVKKKKRRTDKTNDHPLSFPDSMPLMEAVRGIKARKRKRKAPKTCSSSDVVSQSVDDPTIEHLQTETADGDENGELLEDEPSLCEEEIAPDPHFRSSTGNAAASSETITLSETEDGNLTLASFLVQSRGRKSRNNHNLRPNETLQVEAGDNATLGHLYNKLKKRRT